MLPILTLVKDVLTLNLPDGSEFKVMEDGTKCVLGSDTVKTTSIGDRYHGYDYTNSDYSVNVIINNTKTTFIIDNKINILRFNSCGQVRIIDHSIEAIGQAFMERLVDLGDLKTMLATLRGYPEMITVDQDLLESRRERLYKKYSSLVELGRDFGYPECCIREFIMTRFGGMRYITSGLTRKLDGSGYIPCCKCNKKTEQDLILEITKHRSPKYPAFPFDVELSKLSEREKALTRLLNPETTIELINLYHRY